MGTIILFIAILVLLVLVHEWGHFYAAKKLGVRVDEFGIGFPPKLFGKKVGETEYTLNLLPLGGFVKIWGENPEDMADVPEEERGRSFVAQARWKQAIILFAGVAMNVLLAWVLYTIAFFIGVPAVVAEDTPEAAVAALTITAVLPESPAAEYLIPGDKILSIAQGEQTLQTLTPTGISNFTAQSSVETPLLFTLQRGNEELSFDITPTEGLFAEDPQRMGTGIATGLVTFETYGITAPFAAAQRAGEDIVMIVVGFGTLISGLFTGNQEVLSQVAGPVGIAGMVGDAASLGVVWLVLFTGIISLNLAVLNLLPIPALDGGRLVIVAVEAVRRKALNPRIVGTVHVVSFLLLIALMLLVTAQDIIRLF